MAFTAVACGSKPAGEKLRAIKDAGEIVIYLDPNFPPFEFHGENKEVVGVDAEIGKAIAAELGVTAKFKEGEFDSIVMGIKGGDADIAISGLTILEERKENVDFSDKYITSYQYLIVPKASELATVEDLKDNTVGVGYCYSGQWFMEDEIADGVLKDSKTKIKECNSAADAILELKNNRVAAIVMDEYVAKALAAKPENADFVAKKLAYADGKEVAEDYGVAIPKGNPDLVAEINKVIKKLNDEGKIIQWAGEFIR